MHLFYCNVSVVGIRIGIVLLVVALYFVVMCVDCLLVSD